VSVTVLPDPKLTPRLEAGTRAQVQDVGPMLDIVFRMAAEEPVPISIMAMTAPTPITIPRVVNRARIGLRFSALIAVRPVV